QQNIQKHQPQSTDDVRQCPSLAAFSLPMRAQADALKRFLLENLYRHHRVIRMTTKARRIVRELFIAYRNEPRLLSTEYRRTDPTA
ncbi:MAG TPA: deoxyguanosinetriphosphate triphosphohydrolase, partial [Pusillimonas sp.]|nr:deoxyguanosinetriphosphate triphosphohydrolase [Pusillimonas sp.]